MARPLGESYRQALLNVATVGVATSTSGKQFQTGTARMKKLSTNVSTASNCQKLNRMSTCRERSKLKVAKHINAHQSFDNFEQHTSDRTSNGVALEHQYQLVPAYLYMTSLK